MEWNVIRASTRAINQLAECNITKLCIYGWKCYRIQHWLFPGHPLKRPKLKFMIFILQILHISADWSPHQNVTFDIKYTKTYHFNTLYIFFLSFQRILQWLRVLTIKCREERWMLDFPRREQVVVSGEWRCPECPEWNKWRKSDTCAQLPAFSVVLAGTKVSQKWLWCLRESRVSEWDSGEDQISMTDTAAEER